MKTYWWALMTLFDINFWLSHLIMLQPIVFIFGLVAGWFLPFWLSSLVLFLSLVVFVICLAKGIKSGEHYAYYYLIPFRYAVALGLGLVLSGTFHLILNL